MSYYPEFAQLIDEYLVVRDLSGAHLARRLGVDPSTVTRWRNGHTRPDSPEMVARLADVLGIRGKERAQLLVLVGYGLWEGAQDSREDEAEEALEDLAPLSAGAASSWQAYPETYRQAEIAEIAQWLQMGASGIVEGLAGSGVSTLLSHIVNRPAVIAKHLPQIDPSIILIWVDLQPVDAPVGPALYRLLLRGILEVSYQQSHQQRESLPAEILQRCQAALDEKDSFDLQSVLLQLLAYCQSAEIRLLFVFDRIDRLDKELQRQIGNTLRAIRDRYRETVLYLMGLRIFPTYMESIIALGDLGRLLSTHICTVGALSEDDSRFVIAQRTRRARRSPSDIEIQCFLTLSGGYPTLLKAVIQWWQTQNPTPPRSEWLALLGQERGIQLRLQEIWGCLSDQEQEATEMLIRQPEPTLAEMDEIPQATWLRLARLGLCWRGKERWVLANELLKGA